MFLHAVLGALLLWNPPETAGGAEQQVERLLEATGGRSAWAAVRSSRNEAMQYRPADPVVVRAIIHLDFEKPRFHIETLADSLRLVRVIDHEKHWRIDRQGAVVPVTNETLAADRRWYAAHVYRTIHRLAQRDPALTPRQAKDGRLEIVENAARLAWFKLDARGEPYAFGAHDDDAGTLCGPWTVSAGGIRHPAWTTSADGTFRAQIVRLSINPVLRDSMFLASSQSPEIEHVSLTTQDGKAVRGVLHRAANAGVTRAPVLLLHDANGNSDGTHADVAARLSRMGVNTMRMELRAGDQAGERASRECAAEQDIASAAAYLRERFQQAPVILGSGFSATLALRYAAEDSHSIRALLGFAPAQGGPLSSCEADGTVLAAARGVPMLFFRAESELREHSHTDQQKLFLAHGIDFRPVPGDAHGSDLMQESLNPSGAAAVRGAALEFLMRQTWLDGDNGQRR